MNINTIEAFPLHWPLGYKRTPPEKRTYSRFQITMDKAQQFLRNELRLMGASNLIVSTNIPLRRDGMMYADWMNKKIDDSGVAIYFKHNNKDVTMCCDKYNKIWENVYALGKGIEGLRTIARHDISEFIERAFKGFTALPEQVDTRVWFEILSVAPTVTKQDLLNAYRQKAMEFHPDKGGTHDQFIKIQAAYKEGLEQIKDL